MTEVDAKRLEESQVGEKQAVALAAERLDEMRRVAQRCAAPGYSRADYHAGQLLAEACARITELEAEVEFLKHQDAVCPRCTEIVRLEPTE